MKRRIQAATAPDATRAVGPFDILSDLWRHQLALSAHVLATVFQGFEAMRAVQGQAAHDARTVYGAAAAAFLQSRDVPEAVGLETELVRFDLEEGVRYWRELASIALQSQTAVGDCFTGLIGLKGAPPWQTALEVWQSPFLAPLD